ncbi:MAG: hypothetical protein QXQ98_00525 [Zestosphaera sp.]
MQNLLNTRLNTFSKLVAGPEGILRTLLSTEAHGMSSCPIIREFINHLKHLARFPVDC